MKLRLACAALLIASAALGADASLIAAAARKAEKAGKVSQAYLLYSQASGLEPKNKLYRARAAALETRAALASNVMPADTAVLPEDVDPATIFDEGKLGAPEPPPELLAKPDRLDLDIQGDYKSLFTQVATLYGLEPIFDSDYDQAQRIRFHMDGVNYREALHGLEVVTNSFVTPISPKLFLVAKDTPPKRADLEQSITVTVPIPQATTPQELIELAQTIRQVMDIQKITWDSKSDQLIMRDRVSRVMPARSLLQDLFSYRAQVVVDLQLIEIRKSDITNFGATIPNIFNIAFTGVTGSAAASTVGNLPSSLFNPFPFGSRSYDFLALASQGGASGGVQAILHGLFPTSLSMFSIGIGEAQALMNFTQSVGRNILTAEVRASDGQAATFHLGDKFPILTSSYAVGVSVQAQYVPPPSFTFEDLGVSLKVTPHIHGMDEATIEVESDFKLLTGESVNGNPIISTRKLKSEVRLVEGEWGVIAGLTSTSRSRTVDGTAGLSSVPLLSHLFSQHRKENDDSEILILMKPRLLSTPGTERVMHQVRVGSETKPFLPL